MISVGFRTDKGLARGNNEDSVFVLPGKNIYLVADGVGGQNSGQIASRTAVSYMAQYIVDNSVDKIEDDAHLKRYFLDIFSGANDLVFKKAFSEPSNYGMATTVVLCYVRENMAYVVNVGDSRAYIVSDGHISQITKDHTRVQDLLDIGIIDPEQAENHPDKHKITRAVGGQSVVRPDFFRFEVCPGDTIIMCTDGLYGMVSEEDIARTACRSVTMHGLAADLVDKANASGGEDNVSVVCIRIQ